MAASEPSFESSANIIKPSFRISIEKHKKDSAASKEEKVLPLVENLRKFAPDSARGSQASKDADFGLIIKATPNEGQGRSSTLPTINQGHIHVPVGRLPTAKPISLRDRVYLKSSAGRFAAFADATPAEDAAAVVW